MHGTGRREEIRVPDVSEPSSHFTPAGTLVQISHLVRNDLLEAIAVLPE